MIIKCFLSSLIGIVFVLGFNNSAWANCKPIGLWSNCGEYFEHKLGHTYVGEFKSGKPEGYGRINFSKNSERSGDYYVGWFKQGIMYGEGRYYYSNGDKYFGKFTADVKNGTGLLLKGGETFEQRYEFGLLLESTKRTSPPLTSKEIKPNSKKSTETNKIVQNTKDKKPQPITTTKKPNTPPASKISKFQISHTSLWLLLGIISFVFVLVFAAKTKPKTKAENIELITGKPTKQRTPNIDNSIKTRRPDKRLLKKIEYADEKAEIEKRYNGTEYEIPEKFLKTKNIRRSIRKKIEEN